MKAIVEYETSLGLRVMEFENDEDLLSYVDEDKGVFCIEERKKNQGNKEVAIISLESFVSFTRKEA